MSNRKQLLLCIFVLLIALTMSFDSAQAARWRYHAWRNGSITVWGTRNCRIVTWPIAQRSVQTCHTYSGYLPWYANDYYVRFYWGPPCHNITWTKYIARPCPRSCWWNRWVLGPLTDYIDEYVPQHYGTDTIILPSLGDPEGHLHGNQELYLLVDLGLWLDAGQPYTPPQAGTDPNSIAYMFVGGTCSQLPGFMASRRPFVFDPDADPMGYPMINPEPFTGELRLQDEVTFATGEWPGALMDGDNNYDGRVDLLDLGRFAGVWLNSGGGGGGAVGMWDIDDDGEIDAAVGGEDCDDGNPTVGKKKEERCDGLDNDCDGTVDEGQDLDADGFFEGSCGGGPDCDDTDPYVHPGAAELCDGRDNDCDGMIDNKDMDSDSFFDLFCGAGGNDCDDNNPSVHPGAEELCDGLDNDCDGMIDNRDMDADNFFDIFCGAGGNDCDDSNPNVHPGAMEDCYNGRDDDCDGMTDMSDPDCGPPCNYNGYCEPWEGETSQSCPSDCYCGNGTCEPWEDPMSCPWDCGGGGFCGDGMCQPELGEDPMTCPQDCGGMCNGDGICDPWEDPATCPDCFTACGNGVCDPGETPWNCPPDCAPCWMTCPTQCHGDADCNYFVNAADLAILMAAYGYCYPDPRYNPCADFNRNGCVDSDDYAILDLFWMQPPPPDCPPGPPM